MTGVGRATDVAVTAFVPCGAVRPNLHREMWPQSCLFTRPVSA
jgi:hypothetical protein